MGDVDPLAIQREMINRTINEHFDKEKRLRPKGIKVLSLFFIDEVDKYREYDEAGNPTKGVYARLFEDEYQHGSPTPTIIPSSTATRHTPPRTCTTATSRSTARAAGPTPTRTTRRTGTTPGASLQPDHEREGEAARPRDAAEVRLLPFRAAGGLGQSERLPDLCFAGHPDGTRTAPDDRPRPAALCQSAGRSGTWVRRQYADRGSDGVLREDFAAGLQKEIEEETGIRFGVVEPHQFAAIRVDGDDGRVAPLGFQASQALWDHLRDVGYIDAHGRVQDLLRAALTTGHPHRPPGVQGSGRPDHGHSAQARRTPRGQERERATTGPSAARRAPERRVQGPVGPHQVQDHLPRRVRQHSPD